ncbi:MAG TPA: hypothetical protein VJ746_18040 [Nitrospira sp.]|nr:hypothetical protein [Nitrospira sp.]
MYVQHFIVGLVLIMLNGCQHSLVRDSMPTVTRTGEVKDIVILDTLSPGSVTVNPGDEIRWINKRQGDVEVIFLTPVMERLTCQRNFGGLIGADRNQYTAKLNKNETASLCFRDPGELKFVVRAESTDPSGEVNLAGSITIGSEALARPSVDKGTGHTAQSPREEPNR